MTTPTVSVVLPTFNRLQYLRGAAAVAPGSRYVAGPR